MNTRRTSIHSVMTEVMSCLQLCCENSSEPARPDTQHKTRNTSEHRPSRPKRRHKQQSAHPPARTTHRTTPKQQATHPTAHPSLRLIRTRTINPPEVVVERAIPGLHRSPTRKTPPPGDTHHPTTNALPVRLPHEVLPIPHVEIIITVTIRERAWPGGPGHHVHQPSHDVRNLELVEPGLGQDAPCPGSPSRARQAASVKCGKHVLPKIDREKQQGRRRRRRRRQQW
jgi:hypothetical protein